MSSLESRFPPGAARMLGLICLGVVLSMTPWFSATAILPELRDSWHMSPAQSAVLTNAVQAGFVVSALGMSVLNIADIVPPVRLMAVGAVASALCTAALAAVDGVLAASLLRFLTGLSLALVYPPAMKLTTTWFVKGRGLALGLVIGGLTLGSAMPHLLRSLLPAIDWHLVVLGAAAMALAGAGIFVALVREGPHPHARARFNRHQIGQVFRSRPVALANLGYFGHMWELYAMWAWLLVYIQHMPGPGGGAISARGASLIVFVVISTGVVGAIAGGLLADRVGRTLTTAGMMLTSAACALLIGLTFDGPLWLFVALAMVWGAAVIGDSAQFSAMVTEVADSHLVGTALALQMGVGFLITMVSIQILPLFADALGSWRWAFVMLIPGPLIGAAAVLRLRALPGSLLIAQGLR